jgi:hypothetical protein
MTNLDKCVSEMQSANLDMSFIDEIMESVDIQDPNYYTVVISKIHLATISITNACHYFFLCDKNIRFNLAKPLMTTVLRLRKTSRGLVKWLIRIHDGEEILIFTAEYDEESEDQNEISMESSTADDLYNRYVNFCSSLDFVSAIIQNSGIESRQQVRDKLSYLIDELDEIYAMVKTFEFDLVIEGYIASCFKSSLALINKLLLRVDRRLNE